MSAIARDTNRLRLRVDLLVRPLGRDGGHVVKDLRSGTYYNLGPEESFLLLELGGDSADEEIIAAYEAKFGELLDEEDLAGFIELARERNLVHEPASGPVGARHVEGVDDLLEALRNWPIPGYGPEPDSATAEVRRRESERVPRSVVYLRMPLYDPARLFSLLEPRLRFVWTAPFLIASACLVFTSGVLAWSGRGGFVNQFSDGWGWRTIALGWLALAITTACHEAAHGLTCKRFGGEVREVGFLLMYFIPCFYCNVSDAWLFSERWKRLCVTLAGGYCDLVLWSLGLLVWRVTQPGAAIHDFAWFTASTCGFRVFFNVNPLLKLDGYYFLSDLLEIPNLRRRARDRFKGWVRCVLWGARRPGPEPAGRLLLGYGMIAWVFSLAFLSITIAGFAVFFFSKATAAGVAWTAVLGFFSARRLFRDFTKGEVLTMLDQRRGRTRAWLFAGAAVTTAFAVVQVEDRAGGTFMLRPSIRAEVRAPVAGFLREVAADEGTRISPSDVVVRLDVPDLQSRLAQKRAQTRESEAKVKLLEIGPRPEEVQEQGKRVDRARAWRDLARHDLVLTRRAHEQELTEIEGQIRQFHAEADRASEILRRNRLLIAKQALQLDEFRESEKAARVAQAQLSQAAARKGARLAEGTLKAEAELARRESELSESEAALRLLTAGTRPEDLEVELARRDRLHEELRYLEHIEQLLDVHSPISGVVTTPRLRERIGRFLQEGELITEVEAPNRVEAEVVVAEQDVSKIRPNDGVVLKVRGCPFETYRTRVGRIAPATRPENSRTGQGATRTPPAASSDAPGAFVVYCELSDQAGELKTGMTGYARIYLGPTSIGSFIAQRALRLIRTEFWW